MFMRYAFGLTSLLVSVAIMLWLFAGPMGGGGVSYLGVLAKERKQATAQVNEMSGKAADGSEKATDSITFEVTQRGGVTDAILIKTVRPGGTMDVRYGLQAGDEITEIGPLPVRGGGIISSEAEARDFLLDGFARKSKLTVRRAGAKLELPTSDFVPPAFVPVAPATMPTVPTMPSDIDESISHPPLFGGLRKVPTH